MSKSQSKHQLDCTKLIEIQILLRIFFKNPTMKIKASKASMFSYFGTHKFVFE